MMHPPSVSRPGRNRRRSGNAIIEFSLLMPWFVLMFAALLDFGFYAYSLITVQNATRSAAIATAMGGSAGQAQAAWPVVTSELSRLPNVSGSAPCIGGSGSPCTDGRGTLTVTAQKVTGPDGKDASEITVQYTTVALFPLPFLTGQLTIVRRAEARVL